MMESKGEIGEKEAAKFASFYVDLIENHLDTFAYHLSDDALIDWFGRSVKGAKNISAFLKQHVADVRHHFPNIEGCDTIGYRDSHVVNYTPRKLRSSPITRKYEERTPPNRTVPGCSKAEIGQGDGPHNDEESPVKKSRLAVDVIEGETSASPPGTSSLRPSPEINKVTAVGHIEFHRRSTKKFQRETKWSRPCKFQAAFSETQAGYLIHMVIYQDNMRCKRNLLKDFEAVDPPKK